MPTYSFTMPLADFDSTLLGTGAQQKDSEDYPIEVQRFLQSQFDGFGGTARIIVAPDLITVEWNPASAEDPLDTAISQLRAGQYAPAIVLLEFLLQQNPDNVTILYNLGMAYSDRGQLPRAVTLLSRASQIDSKNVNVCVALGVALLRQERTEEAVPVFERAIADEPKNSWAYRNLGACLLKLGKHEQAQSSLQRATELNPRDQQAFLGLAQAFHAQDNLADADSAYCQVLAIDEFSDIAERARDGRREISHDEFRRRGQGTERKDAVMYCLSAMEKFAVMAASQVQKITFEIAMLGTRGLDVNNPAQKYKLRSLPGNYSGLQLVSYMYVGFKRIAPGQDAGFDLSKEYAVAESLFSSRRDEGK